jgi:glycosyltransferase involved in cell wall biosynthesis
MRLIYLVNQRIPTEKAYGVQISKMCEAFSDAGVEVTLLAPFRKSLVKENIFDYYSLKNNFKFKRVWSFDFYLPGSLDRLAFWIKNLMSALILSLRAWLKRPDIIYSRDELVVFLLSFTKVNVVFEAHKFAEAKKFFYRRFLGRNLKIVTISKGIKDEFVRNSFNPSNILVAHDGVDIEKFSIDTEQDELRKELGLPLNSKLVGYVGSFSTFGMPKGLDILLKAMAKVKSQEVKLVMVGSSVNPSEVKEYYDLTESLGIKDKIIFVGKVPYGQVPKYLKALDILVAPYPDQFHYRHYMSPLKIFEYMASGRPMIVSDLPSIREVLNEKTATLVRPDNPGELAKAVDLLVSDEQMRKALSEVALEEVKHYSWGKRARHILEFSN